MQPPDKKRRKEIRDSLKAQEAQLWEAQRKQFEQQTASLANSIELKNHNSNDRMFCDALYRKMETMAAKKEITLVSGSFNIYGNPVEFIENATGRRYIFTYTDMERSGSCSLASI